MLEAITKFDVLPRWLCVYESPYGYFLRFCWMLDDMLAFMNASVVVASYDDDHLQSEFPHVLSLNGGKS